MAFRVIMGGVGKNETLLAFAVALAIVAFFVHGAKASVRPVKADGIRITSSTPLDEASRTVPCLAKRDPHKLKAYWYVATDGTRVLIDVERIRQRC